MSLTLPARPLRAAAAILIAAALALFLALVLYARPSVAQAPAPPAAGDSAGQPQSDSACAEAYTPAVAWRGQAECRALPALAAPAESAGLTSLAPAVAATDPPTGTVYLHAHDVALTAEYKTLFEASGSSVTLVAVTDVLTISLTSATLIVIGPDTGAYFDWPTGVSGASPQAEVVAAAGVPIMGLGNAGYAFYGKLDAPIGSPHGWHGTLDDVTPVNELSPFWQTPEPVTPITETVSLYTEGVNHVAIYLPEVTGVVALGMEGETHASLVAMAGKPWLLWGFGGAPSQMTDEGRALLGNAVAALGNHPESLHPIAVALLPVARR